MPNTALPTKLLKSIDLSKATARGLRAAFALPPDESDFRTYACGKLRQRIKALDAYFGFDIGTPDLPQRRFKALFELIFGVPANSGDWYCHAYLALLLENGVSFYFERRGRPSEWSFDSRMLLLADHQQLKRKYPDLKGDIFWTKLRSFRPKAWGKYSIFALRKAYASAKKCIPTAPPGYH